MCGFKFLILGADQICKLQLDFKLCYSWAWYSEQLIATSMPNALHMLQIGAQPRLINFEYGLEHLIHIHERKIWVTKISGSASDPGEHSTILWYILGARKSTIFSFVVVIMRCILLARYSHTRTQHFGPIVIHVKASNGWLWYTMLNLVWSPKTTSTVPMSAWLWRYTKSSF